MLKHACAVLAAFTLMVLAGCGGGDAPKTSGGGAKPAAGGGEKKAEGKPKAEKKGGEAFPKDAKGSIKGVVSLEGEAKRKQIDVSGDKFCAANHEKDALLTEEIVAKDGKLANVIVYVKKGAEKYTFDIPAAAAKIDQKGCQYIPHVLAVMAGQEIEVLNSDETTHNIHGKSPTGENPEFNISQATKGKVDKKKLESAELPYTVGCDVHKWMGAKVGVFDHTLFAVTGEDGKFEITGLPDGEYEVEAWHESLKTQSGKVTVKGAAAEQNFSFKK